MSGRTIYLIMWSLILAACTSDDGQPSDGSTVPVAFSATMASDNKPTTRASGDDTSTSAFGQVIDEDKLQSLGFGVFACYTGLHGYGDSNVHPDFMYNEKVTYKTDHWEYNPVKYWPNGEGEVSGNTGSEKHYVSFMAYAPYSDGSTGDAGYCIPSFSLQGEVGNPWLTYRLIPQKYLAHQVDLLYADPLLDRTKPATNYKLPFVFNHALACVGDKVSINCSPAMKNLLQDRVSGGITNARLDVTQLEIVYTLTSKARLVLWNGGEANWEPIYSEQPTCTRTVTLVDAGHPVVAYAVDDPGITTKISEWNDKGVFYIPIGLPGFPQTAQVNLTYHVSTYNDSDWIPGPTKEGSVTINLNAYPDAYKPGKHLYINITVNDETMTFTVTAAIADWGDGGTWGSSTVPIEAI